jgi:hypothetical protein
VPATLIDFLIQENTLDLEVKCLLKAFKMVTVEELRKKKLVSTVQG